MPGLRIGLVTSWNERCGIAEYSRCLAAALVRRGNEVTILANCPAQPVSWAGDDASVCRFFLTEWHPAGLYNANVDQARRAIADRRIEILHIQYQNTIYRYPFVEVMPRLVEGVPTVVTFHDPTFPRHFPAGCVEAAVFHNEVAARLSADMSWKSCHIIPPGILNPGDPGKDEARACLGIESHHVLATIGVRTDHPRVLAAIARLLPDYPDLVYLVAAPPELPPASYNELQHGPYASRVRLLVGFPPLEELLIRLHAADICIFYYPELGVEGTSSAAARLGIGARRPVIVSDVSLMRDLPHELKVPYGDPAALAARIRAIWQEAGLAERLLSIQELLIAEHNWDETAARHEGLYHQVLNRVGVRRE